MSSTNGIHRGVMEQLGMIMDTATGLTYCCDNEQFYKEMLLAYLDNQKYDSIEDAYQREDWENYRILVHSLKSTSLSIGATHISDQAKALEMAAKESDIGYIREHHGSVMENYRKLLLDLNKILWEPAEERESSQEWKDTVPDILVVDDDNMNLRIAQKMLKAKFQVDVVNSGEKALAFLKDGHPDLILLDLHMPGMDGFEVMKLLQADDSYREIPVIFLTAKEKKKTEVR